jgi:ERCC4-type nuclease
MPRSSRRRRCGSARRGGSDRPHPRSFPAHTLAVRLHPGQGAGGDLLADAEDGPRRKPGRQDPTKRSLAQPVTIIVDTRERYPYRFAQQGAETARATVAAGDYAVHASDGNLLAAVERKSLDNLAATLSDGTLAFQMQRLAELPLAAVVVEARYTALFKLEPVNGDWLADQLARLQVRYPEVHLVFADSRRYAEDWTYRFLTTALADTHESSPNH